MLKLKTSGVMSAKTLTGWYQDYVPNPQNPAEWLPHGSKVSWSGTQYNGSCDTITYDATPQTGGFLRTRYCHHTKQRIESTSPMESHYIASTGNRRREAFAPGLQAPLVHSIPYGTLSAYHVEALNFFKAGCTDKEFSLAVNLLEIKEVPRLLTELPSMLRSLRKSGRRFKGASNAHLWYSFGLRPLISDIKAAVSTLQNLEQRIAWFRKNEGKPVRVRFRKDLSKLWSPAPVTGSDSSGWWVTRSDYQAAYQAHVTIRYRTELLDDLSLKLRVLTRSFGLDSPLEWAWECIPFSFVLDWFIGIGRFLEALGPKIIVPYDILDCGWSVKITESRGFEAWRYRPYKSSGKTNNWKATTTTYHREAGLPVSFSLVSNDPGLSQLALGISLFIQRIK